MMLVKDEADMIETTITHLLAHVDEVHVTDNGSTDGTREILEALPVRLSDDPDPAYWQSAKTSRMALDALSRGHKWVLPCDADEIWTSNDGRRIGDYLAGLAPDTMICPGQLYNHLPTREDPTEGDPVARIGFRQRQHQELGKVACRLRDDLVIEAGNHSARVKKGPLTKAGRLPIRHFSWRTPEQYVRKVRNGIAAYAATNLPPSVGAHWRMWEDRTDEEIIAHFERWFLIDNPHADDTLIYDPAPVDREGGFGGC